MQPVSRRTFTGQAMTLSVAVAAGPSAIVRAATRLTRQDASPFDWKPIGDGARVAMGQGGNALVFTSNGQAALIDCKNLGYGHALLAESQSDDVRLAGVFNTHHHGDHVGGNNAFFGLFDIHAHPNCVARVKEQAPRYSKAWNERLRGDKPELKAEAWVPRKKIHSGQEFRVGESVFSAHYVGPGHTDNDMFFYFPDRNILHTGDLVFHKLHPFMDVGAGGASAGWIKSCEAMLKVCDDDTIVVPGHGDITDKTGIERQREYFLVIREAIKKNIDAGKDRDEAIKIDPPMFEGMGFVRIRDRTLGMVYDELTASHD